MGRSWVFWGALGPGMPDPPRASQEPPQESPKTPKIVTKLKENHSKITLDPLEFRYGFQCCSRSSHLSSQVSSQVPRQVSSRVSRQASSQVSSEFSCQVSSQVSSLKSSLRSSLESSLKSSLKSNHVSKGHGCGEAEGKWILQKHPKPPQDRSKKT